jgi:hypothetical protein
MAEAKKKRARTQAEAGLVEKDFEQLPNSEAVADGEAFDADAVAESVEDAAALGMPHATAVQFESQNNPYVSQEEQFMEMTPKVFGPPAYGSPDPLSAAGRLVPVEDHPLAAGRAPEASAIAEDYAADVTGANLAPGEGAHPGGPQRSDLELDGMGLQGERVAAAENAASYEEMSKDELLELAGEREIAGRSSMNKEELVEAHAAYDDASSQA